MYLAGGITLITLGACLAIGTSTPAAILAAGIVLTLLGLAEAT